MLDSYQSMYQFFQGKARWIANDWRRYNSPAKMFKKVGQKKNCHRESSLQT